MDTALLLIDMQNDYFPGGTMQLANIEEAAANAQSLLKLFRRRNAPVIHIQHCSIRPDATFFLPGSDGIKIHPSLAPVAPEPVIRKNYPNSFQKTALASELTSRDIRKLIVCGAMTHMCIDSTVRAAFEHGFTCTVATDSCATRDLPGPDGGLIPAQQIQQSFLAALGTVFAEIRLTRDILAII